MKEEYKNFKKSFWLLHTIEKQVVKILIHCEIVKRPPLDDLVWNNPGVIFYLYYSVEPYQYSLYVIKNDKSS